MRNTHPLIAFQASGSLDLLQGNVPSPVSSRKSDPLGTVPSTVVSWATGGQQPILVFRLPDLKGQGRDKESGSMSQFSTSSGSGFQQQA